MDVGQWEIWVGDIRKYLIDIDGVGEEQTMDVGQWEIWVWNICKYLLTIDGVGEDRTAKCNAAQHSIKCPRRGRCLIAKMRVSRTVDQARGTRQGCRCLTNREK